MKKILTMFFSFFKIGAFTFGGGYAMIPLIEKEVVFNKNWLSKDEFSDLITISQSFPGALAVNSCVFIGYKVGGLLGAIFALLGVVLPSFFIILFIASFFITFRSNVIVDKCFKGISAAVPILVLVAIQSLSKSLDAKNLINWIIVILTMILILVFDIHPVIIIISSALYGAIFLRKKV